MTAEILKVNDSSTDQQLIEYVAQQVNLRYRFLETETILPAPTPIQIQLSVEDALNEINSKPPQTFYSLRQVLLGNDTRWKSLLIVGTAKEVLKLRVVEWAANGYDSPIEDLPMESKLADYETSLNAIKEDFSERLEALKATSQKAVRRANASMANPLSRGSYNTSGRIYGRF